MVPFTQGFRIKLCLLFPHKYFHLTHLDLITSQYLVRRNHNATHSTMINILQFHSLSPVHTFPSSLCIQTPTIDATVYRNRYCWLGQPWNHGYISGRGKRCFIFQVRTKRALPGANVSRAWTRLCIWCQVQKWVELNAHSTAQCMCPPRGHIRRYRTCQIV